MEDTEIIALYFARNESAIDRTQEKYGRKLRELAQHICRESRDAEECENSTYWTAWNTIPPHDPQKYFFPYLAKIVRAAAFDCCRAAMSQKRNAELLPLSEELDSVLETRESVENALDGAELSRIVGEFLKTCSAEKRGMFLRRYWYMDSVHDIAKRYSCKESKVKTALFRLRNDLRLYLEQEGYTV